MRVVIVGLGDTGRDLAKYLMQRGTNEIVLIDLDEERCEQLAGEIDALVLKGDGTDPEILEKAQLKEADALVATTGSDAINTVIAMLGHRMGVEKIIVKLNDIGLRAACQEIGVKRIVTPKISAAAEILASLYGYDNLNFSLVVRGGLNLVDIEAGRAKGKKLEELDMPDGCLVVSVVRDDNVLIPRGKTRIEENDLLYVLVENDSVLKKVREIFGS